MSTIATPADSWLTLEQVMSRTGFSYRHLRGLIASGRLIGYRLPGGHHIRVKATDLDCLFQPIPVRGN